LLEPSNHADKHYFLKPRHVIMRNTEPCLR